MQAGTSGLNCRAILWSDFNAKEALRPLASWAEFLARVTAPKGRAAALLEFNHGVTPDATNSFNF
jgi:hypothetical protein